MNSIRTFLTIALLAVVTLVNFVASLRGYQNSMVEAERLFNQRMYQQVDLLEYTLPDLLARGDIREGRLWKRARSFGVGATLEFQWLDAEGELLAHTDLMPDTLITPLKEGFEFVNLNGYRWHVLVTRSADRNSWFVLAERDDQRYRMAESVIGPAVYPMVFAIPILGVIIWTLLGIGLKPIQRLATDVETREATDLRPLDDAQMPSELRQLARSANALLRRLEASFARESRFAADAAHELRTPIAALSIQCENLAFAAPEHAANIAKLQTSIQRLHHVVSQILILNRVAPDHYMAKFEPVNLCHRAREAIVLQGETLKDRTDDIEFSGHDAWILGDGHALDSLLSNLLGNAIKFTPVGGRIHVSVEQAGNVARLMVIDSGIGIPPAQRERVFDRFYRLGGDRNESQVVGCGLGLSIVRQVAELHGATVSMSDAPAGQGLCVAVDFPLVRLSAKAAGEIPANTTTEASRR
ncbi:MAG: sensor histidine kinase [Pseudomarimonas sp.]